MLLKKYFYDELMRIIENRPGNNQISEQAENILTDAAGAIKAKLERINTIYYPENIDDIISAVKYTYENAIPITIAGARTGLNGGAVASHGGAVLVMDQMLSVSDLEEKLADSDGRNATAKLSINTYEGRVEYYIKQLPKQETLGIFPAGVSLQSLDSILKEHNLWYPVNPTEQSAQLGGTVSTNASGSRTFGYGATREHVEWLKIVLPDSDTLTVRRGEIYAINGILNFTSDNGREYKVRIPAYKMPDVKNAAGLYSKPSMDLIDLFIGAEGTLGVVSEIGIKLQKRRNIEEAIIFFDSDDEACRFVEMAKLLKYDKSKEKGIIALEYYDEGALQLARIAKTTGVEVKPNARAAIQVEYFSDDDLTLETIATIIENEFSETTVDSWIGKEIIEFRHSVPETANSLTRNRPEVHKLGTDLAVPDEAYSIMHKKYLDVKKSFKEFCMQQMEPGEDHDSLYSAIWGHIGNNHVHFNFLPKNKIQLEKAKDMYLELAQLAVKLGGTISAEHGIGKKVFPTSERVYGMPYLYYLYGEKGLKETGRTIADVDRKSLMNVGNITTSRYAIKDELVERLRKYSLNLANYFFDSGIVPEDELYAIILRGTFKYLVENTENGQKIPLDPNNLGREDFDIGVIARRLSRDDKRVYFMNGRYDLSDEGEKEFKTHYPEVQGLDVRLFDVKSLMGSAGSYYVEDPEIGNHTLAYKIFYFSDNPIVLFSIHPREAIAILRMARRTAIKFCGDEHLKLDEEEGRYRSSGILDEVQR